MYNHNKAQQSSNRVHISILYDYHGIVTDTIAYNDADVAPDAIQWFSENNGSNLWLQWDLWAFQGDFNALTNYVIYETHERNAK